MNSYINPRQKILHHTGHLDELRRVGTTFAPINVEIDLSNRCSLGCQWCHFSHTHTRGPLANKMLKLKNSIPGGDLMPLALACSIIDQLQQAGVKSVTWTGGGEPTLHPQFDDVICYAQKVGLEQGLYTHGGHINAERAQLLKQTLTWVYVSLDECTPDSYAASKGVGPERFERAVDGIRHLVRAEGSATVGIGFLLHEGNWRDVHDMVRLARSLEVNYAQFRPTIRFEHAAPVDLQEDAAWIDRALGRLAAYSHDPFVLADAERFRAYQHWTGHGYTTCYWSAMQTVITPNGKMWRCVNKREQADALIGDLSAERFADIWQRAGRPCAVDGQCRIMCRGHIPNLTLDAIMQPHPHINFI